MIINKKVTCSISINLLLSLTFNNGVSENGELLNWCYRCAMFGYLYVQGACVINTIATAQLRVCAILFILIYHKLHIWAYILSTTLYRRKKIGLLATQRWGDSLPKFNSPDTKKQLTEFATGITQECGIPEINFNADGIARHIQAFFSEQRRYRKSKIKSCKVCFSTYTWFC